MDKLTKRITLPLSEAELIHIQRMADEQNISITNMIRAKLRLALTARRWRKKKNEGEEQFSIDSV